MRQLKGKLPTWIAAWGLAATIAAFLGWLAGALLPIDFHLGAGGMSVAVALVVFAFVGGLTHLILSWPDTNYLRPKLVLYRKDSAASQGLFLFSSVEWLMYGAGYAIFVVDDQSFEQVIGIARVKIIQDDRRVQLDVVKRFNETDEVWKSLDGGSKDYFTKIVIKPGAPHNG